MRSCNFSSFLDGNLGVLREDLGVWDVNAGFYSKKDILHLGRYGIRLLASVLSDCVLSKTVTSRSYSSTLTHHTRGHFALF